MCKISFEDLLKDFEIMKSRNLSNIHKVEFLKNKHPFKMNSLLSLIFCTRYIWENKSLSLLNSYEGIYPVLLSAQNIVDSYDKLDNYEADTFICYDEYYEWIVGLR